MLVVPVLLARPNFKAVLNLAAVLSLGGTAGLTANITLAPWDADPAHAIVEGRLESGDKIQFTSQVGRLTKTIVDFNSDGGDLRAGVLLNASASSLILEDCRGEFVVAPSPQIPVC